MAEIAVVGLVNLETTLAVDGFPVPYAAARYSFFGVRSSVSGVGYNVARALHTLGDSVRLCAMLGTDGAADLVRLTCEREGLPLEGLLSGLSETPQSLIMHDPSGARSIHTDLKDIQERHYPQERLSAALNGCAAAVICNINFARPALHICQALKIPVFTDLHAITDLQNPYDQEFLEAADGLFFSAEHLEHPERTALEVFERFGTKLIVIGLGSRGALLCTRDAEPLLMTAKAPRAIVSSVGAGDALLSSFVHYYLKLGDARAALERAVLFAGWKIGETGGSSGFLSEAALEALLV